jgi:hypothetical protein
MKKKIRKSNINPNISEVHVNWGKLLESKLLEWRGGYHHPRGIAEYITNCDDSYRRLKKFREQIIKVEIHSKSGRKLSKIVIIDFAEGMSLDELNNKFFQYYDSYSGRESGEQVTGRFGTGGKAYAIMNFKHCWITSTQNNFECKFWFKWEPNIKKIIKGITNGGFINKRVDKPNGTIIELVDSLDNKHDLLNIFELLEKEPRIRHVIKNQNVSVTINKKNESFEDEPLQYRGPKVEAVKEWSFNIPNVLENKDPNENTLFLRYFEKPLKEHAFIDLSDGISTVADLDISLFDGRPFSKHINGNLTIRKLQNSNAVKENRKGLEEGHDITVEIERFLKEKVRTVIDEIQDIQREKERQRNIEVSNEKIKELNKFLKKCEMNFKQELKALINRFKAKEQTIGLEDDTNEEGQDEKIYRKPTDADLPESLIKGTWIKHSRKGHHLRINVKKNGFPKFIPDEKGNDYAVEIGRSSKIKRETKTKKSGLSVLMSDDPEIPKQDKPLYSEYDDPVSDKDMETRGIIWINANHPIIYKSREKKEKEPIFKELVANYVLLVVAQYHTQRILNQQAKDEQDDPMMLFRQKFFELQRNLREDKEINYFEEELSE